MQPKIVSSNPIGRCCWLRRTDLLTPQQFGNRNAERRRKQFKRAQRHVALASLYRSYVCAVEAADVGKSFLGELLLLAMIPDVGRQDFTKL
jgi:hypothetical protein